MTLRARPISVPIVSALLAVISCTVEQRDDSRGREVAPVGDSARIALATARSVDGMYVLDSIGLHPIPAAQLQSTRRDLRFEVLAESLWLRRDGSFVARGAYKKVEDGRASQWNAADSGRYTLQGAVLRDDGLLESGDVLLNSGADLSSRLWAKRGGLFLEGTGLPHPQGGTTGLFPRIYRRVPRPGR